MFDPRPLYCSSLTTAVGGTTDTNFVDSAHPTVARIKKLYVTFIDDYSRFARIYLLRSKDEAFDMFLSYKAEVESQLDRKIKRIRSDRGANTSL